jgi:cobaltochelatase CobS
MSNRAELKQKFFEMIAATGKTEISKSEIKEICSEIGLSGAQFFTKDANNRLARGMYRVPGVDIPAMQAQVITMPKKAVEMSDNRIQNVVTDLDVTDLVPKVYKNYVPFGNYDDVLSIVNSKRFFPVFISGHSGNGKTMSVEQACAKAKRKFICVSMTPETDESDLLGNYVLINGNMEWRDGPVTTAARQGAVLCIDEIDYGAQNLSSLQRVLEGKPFMLKKKGELIVPAEGFTVLDRKSTRLNSSHAD